MATQPEGIEDDPILELEEEQQIETEEPDDEPEPEDDLTPPQFEDDEQAAPAENDLVKHLRQQIRDRDRQLSEVRKVAPAEPEIVVGARPKMADFDFDEDRYEAALDAWEASKAAKEKQDQKRQQSEQAQQDQWKRVIDDYAAKKAALRYPDVQQAEETAFDTLSPATQTLIAKYADNSALFVYAVGKSPGKLAELARIDAEGDPFAVVKAVNKMEAKLQKPGSNVRPPAPDTPVRGKPIAAVSADKVLEKLEKEAEKTGDRSKIIAHKRALREKSK